MSRLDEMIAHIQEHGPITMNDLLTEMGFNDPAQRASAKAQLSRELLPGGDRRRLVDEGKIVPSATGPRVAEWEKGLARQPDKHPVVLESRALAPIRELDMSHLPTSLKDAAQAVNATNLTGRKAAVVAGAMTECIHRYEMERVQKEAAQEIAEAARGVIADQKKMIETLLDVVKSKGQDVVPAK
ncbi:MAG: hypothetical protein ACLGJC_18380 [Alphaproteobacteria bacterium]